MYYRMSTRHPPKCWALWAGGPVFCHVTSTRHGTHRRNNSTAQHCVQRARHRVPSHLHWRRDGGDGSGKACSAILASRSFAGKRCGMRRRAGVQTQWPTSVRWSDCARVVNGIFITTYLVGFIGLSTFLSYCAALPVRTFRCLSRTCATFCRLRMHRSRQAVFVSLSMKSKRVGSRRRPSDPAARY